MGQFPAVFVVTTSSGDHDINVLQRRRNVASFRSVSSPCSPTLNLKYRAGVPRNYSKSSMYVKEPVLTILPNQFIYREPTLSLLSDWRQWRERTAFNWKKSREEPDSMLDTQTCSELRTTCVLHVHRPADKINSRRSGSLLSNDLTVP